MRTITAVPGNHALLLLLLAASTLPAVTAANSAQTASESEESSTQLEEVVVTGTHIRGVSPASPLIVLTSTDIANSGLATAGDVLRNLPQSFRLPGSSVPVLLLSAGLVDGVVLPVLAADAPEGPIAPDRGSQTKSRSSAADRRPSRTF